jgi:hypothetical protein
MNVTSQGHINFHYGILPARILIKILAKYTMLSAGFIGVISDGCTAL